MNCVSYFLSACVESTPLEDKKQNKTNVTLVQQVAAAAAAAGHPSVSRLTPDGELLTDWATSLRVG